MQRTSPRIQVKKISFILFDKDISIMNRTGNI
jgi:hypothetical protein